MAAHTTREKQLEEDRARLERLLAERTAELAASERTWKNFF